MGTTLLCIGFAVVAYSILTVAFNHTLVKAARNAKVRSDHFKLLYRARKHKVKVAFIGDSLIMRWHIEGRQFWDKDFAKWRPGNLGMAGESSYGLLNRVKGEELLGIRPKVCVVLIGTNDLSYLSAKPEQISSNIERILTEIKRKLPKTRILLIGILPRGAGVDEVRGQISETNSLLASLDNGKDIRFIDINKDFVDAKGELKSGLFQEDMLHLTTEGYATFAAAIKAPVRKLLK